MSRILPGVPSGFESACPNPSSSDLHDSPADERAESVFITHPKVLPAFGATFRWTLAIPNSIPSRARSDADGPTPRNGDCIPLPPENVSPKCRQEDRSEGYVILVYVSIGDWVTLGLPSRFYRWVTVTFYRSI